MRLKWCIRKNESFFYFFFLYIFRCLLLPLSFSFIMLVTILLIVTHFSGDARIFSEQSKIVYALLLCRSHLKHLKKVCRQSSSNFEQYIQTFRRQIKMVEIWSGTPIAYQHLHWTIITSPCLLGSQGFSFGTIPTTPRSPPSGHAIRLLSRFGSVACFPFSPGRLHKFQENWKGKHLKK